MFGRLRDSRGQSGLIHPQSLARKLRTIGVYEKLTNYFSGRMTELQRDKKEEKPEKMGKKTERNRGILQN